MDEKIKEIQSQLEKEIKQLIYDKFRIYSNITDIRFKLNYNYSMETQVVNSIDIKKNKVWNAHINQLEEE